MGRDTRCVVCSEATSGWTTRVRLGKAPDEMSTDGLELDGYVHFASMVSFPRLCPIDSKAFFLGTPLLMVLDLIVGGVRWAKIQDVL
uniref:Uncharacterized protein n=1 Tax=Triticum urartu TaxID=4572 RepID=A0A8R7QCL8_TRIUA